MLEFQSTTEFAIFMFRMITAILFPVIVAIAIYWLEKRTRFAKLNYWGKQCIIGVIFGGVACLATEFGIPMEGAVLNVRGAAPMTAGLAFGGPAGIIAGTIGALHRWISVMWGVGEYSRLACSLGTFFAGIIAAICRQFMFDNKKTTWLFGYIIGATTEVLHMIILFLTKLDDIHQCFSVILKVSGPMIIGNALSVMLAMLLVSVVGKEKLRYKKEDKTISQIFQSALLCCVIVAFIATSAFSYILHKSVAQEDINTLLKLNLEALPGVVEDMSAASLLQYNLWIAIDIDEQKRTQGEPSEEFYRELQAEYEVVEMYVTDRTGSIVYDGQNMLTGTNIREYDQLASCNKVLSGQTEMVGEYADSLVEGIGKVRYYATALEDGGCVIGGYDESFLVEEVYRHIPSIADNRYVGQTGYLIVADEAGNEVSSGSKVTIHTLQGIGIDLSAHEEMTVFEDTIYKEDVFCMYMPLETLAGTYYAIAVYPSQEALFAQNSSLHLSIFMMVLVFATLFILIYFLIRRIIVKNIHEINTSLAQITKGNLDVMVNVRENEEFSSLSDDINSTVATLKHYIAEAAARIDKELVFAKMIQLSSLPSVFPKRDDFDIYAMMDTAKEVGGDFYDFYMLDEETLGFIMADVSGKGIPAALFMMTAKSIIKGYAERGFEVNEILTNANEELCEGNDADMFVTAWMGIMNVKTGHVSFVNAGHNPPLICRAGGTFEYLKTKADLAVAFLDGTIYTKQEITLQPGDKIYLYTDGVTEATDANTQLYSEERLRDTLNRNPDESVKQRCNTILADVEKFVGEAEQFDDITMMSLLYKGTKD